jgi:putative MATE family efflux protein
VETKRLALLESGPVTKSIIKLALPMMVGMIAQMVYNLTDTFFIGQTGDPNMVAGISLTLPLFMLAQGIGNIFGNGASSYISRLLGARKAKKAKETNTVSFYTTIGMGTVLTLLFFIFREPVLRIIGSSDATFVYANDYFSIISAFTVVSVVNISISGQIRAEGAVNTAMYGMLAGIALNIILDPVFILVLGMGAAGAAWATVIGNIVSTVFLLLHYTGGKSVLSIHFRHFKPAAAIYAEILKMGIPSAVSTLVMTFAAVFTNRIAASYGDFVIAARGITLRVESISFMLIMAMAMGFQPFAGFNYGAKNYKRLKQGLKVVVMLTTSMGLFFVIVFLVWGRFMISLFINDAPTIEAGARFMRAFLFCLPFMGLQMTAMVTFQALGKPVFSTIVTLGRQFLFYLPLLFLMNHTWGFEGFMYSQPLADNLNAIIAAVLGIKTLAGLKHVESEIAVLSEPVLEGAG